MLEKLDAIDYSSERLELYRIVEDNFVELLLKHVAPWGGYATRAVSLWLDNGKIEYALVRVNYNGTGKDLLAERVLMPSETEKLYKQLMSIKTIDEFYNFVETYF